MKEKVLSVFLLIGIVCSIVRPMEVKATATEEIMQQIYIAQEGDDANAGTEVAPLKTLQKAQEKVRELNDDMTGNIEVIIKDGVYHLESTLLLTSEDSGTNGYKVVYKAEEGVKPIISGGISLNEWEIFDEEKNIYVTDVSELGDDFDTRQLYVNGTHAIRSRGDANGSDFTKGNYGFTILSERYTDMGTWRNPEDIELQSSGSWKNHRVNIKSISDKTIQVEEKSWNSSHTQGYFTPNIINMVENAYELLDEENEWYFDKNERKIFYKPIGGVIDNLNIVIGNLEYIIKANGSAEAPVKDVVFDGLQFSYNTWLFPNSEYGYSDFQGGTIYKNDGEPNKGNWVEVNYQTPAGVEFNYTKNSIIQNCTFTSLGNAALSFLVGAENNVIVNNEVHHVSGNGIILGSVYKEAQNDMGSALVRNNEISYNTVHDIGTEYKDNIGIFVGYTNKTNIHHNTLYNLPYTAISMGWGWGETDWDQGAPIAGDNVISHNLIHDFMLELHDGGGIYTLGEQGNSKVYNNYLYNHGNSNFVLYRDNGTVGILDTNNVIEGTKIPYYFSTEGTGTPYHSARTNAVVANYFTAGMNTRGTGQNNNIEIGNVAVENINWPDGAVSVIENAGVTGGEGEIPDLSQPNYGEYEEKEDNIAQVAIASASSEYSTGYQPRFSNDNKKHTRWAAKSGADKDEWIQLDFGQIYNVDKVELVLPIGENFKYKYIIEYSQNGNDWALWYDQNIYTEKQENTYELWGNPVKAQYVRITFKDTVKKGCGLIEFRVFKTDDLVVEKMPVLSCAGENGTITPRGTNEIAIGRSVTYNIVPQKGYGIYNVLVDGVEQGKINSYTFENIQTSHIISASFYRLPIREYEKIDILSAKSSSEYSRDYDSSKAIDGDWENTRWAATSGKLADEWLEVDLGQVQKVDRIQIKNYPYRNNRFKFKIQYRNSEVEGWKDIIVQDTYTENNEMTYELAESVMGKYFQIYFTDTDGNGCSIYEFELGTMVNEGESLRPENTVTFLSNGGSLVESQYVKDEEYVLEPNVPVRVGFTFEGWFSDAECTNTWNFTNTIVSDIRLYAKWNQS